MTLEEYNMSVEEEKKWIRLVNKQGLLIVAEVNGTIIGMLHFQLSPRKRFSHMGSFGISTGSLHQSGSWRFIIGNIAGMGRKRSQGGKDIP
ncbi:MAG: hypothetical protein WB502_14690 [Thermoactinomyces sp.]